MFPWIVQIFIHLNPAQTRVRSMVQQNLFSSVSAYKATVNLVPSENLSIFLRWKWSSDHKSNLQPAAKTCQSLIPSWQMLNIGCVIALWSADRTLNCNDSNTDKEIQMTLTLQARMFQVHTRCVCLGSALIPTLTYRRTHTLHTSMPKVSVDSLLTIVLIWMHNKRFNLVFY